MRVIIQRVSEASVTINKEEKRSIGEGLVVLLGIHDLDNIDDIKWLSKKIVNLRIFGDEEDKMNKSVKDINGEILLISQFTLFAGYKKGNRPSFIQAAKPNVAIPLYENFKNKLEAYLGKVPVYGEFGAHMDVHIVNNGPVTIYMDSKHPE